MYEVVDSEAAPSLRSDLDEGSSVRVDDDHRRQEYLDQRRLYTESLQDAQKSHDNAILTLSSAVLALSIAFIKDTISQPIGLIVLKAAWLTLSISIVAMVASFLTSRYAHLAVIRRFDSQYAASEPPTLPNDMFAKLTTFLTIWSFVTFAVGMVLLCVFGFVNY